MTEQWDNDPRAPRVQWASTTYRRWQSSPSWAQRLVGALFLILLIGLGTLLLLGGLIAGAVVTAILAVLWAVFWIVRRIRAALGTEPASSGEHSDSGRDNVRVIGPTQRQ